MRSLPERIQQRARQLGVETGRESDATAAPRGSADEFVPAQALRSFLARRNLNRADLRAIRSQRIQELANRETRFIESSLRVGPTDQPTNELEPAASQETNELRAAARVLPSSSADEFEPANE